MYRALAELYGWTPQQIAAMTPAQIDIYAGEEAQLERDIRNSGGQIRTTPSGRRIASFSSNEEALAFMEQQKERRRARS